MSFDDSADMSFPESGESRLMSESLFSGSSSQTGPGGDDLSLSELSLSDRTALFQKPFSLLAQPEPATPVQSGSHSRDDAEEDGEDGGDIDSEGEGNTILAEEDERIKRNSAKTREEKLQSDIFILKKLNASFALFNEALEDTESANERLAAQLEQTEGLLNKYVKILSRSEDFARLIFDEHWDGAEADEEIILREETEAAERARQEAEERALAAQREQERLEREEQERTAREERERLEREKKERGASRGGVRGVRGTRASMRGVRGAGAPTRAGSTAASRGSGIPTAQTSTTGTIRRTTGIARGVSRRA